jgi:hypothetical protein
LLHEGVLTSDWSKNDVKDVMTLDAIWDCGSPRTLFTLESALAGMTKIDMEKQRIFSFIFQSACKWKRKSIFGTRKILRKYFSGILPKFFDPLHNKKCCSSISPVPRIQGIQSNPLRYTTFQWES